MRMATLAIILLANSAALAQTQPLVRAEIKPESVIVGEAAELTITVLVPSWFTRPPVYPTFELANAITRMPADSSYPLRERIGNESWSGIVRTYEIYPLMGASYRMAGQTMNVTFANPGSDPITVDIEVPEVVLRGVVPEGAESLDPYLAGRSLELALDVDGELDALETGDAVVLTYRAELDGLPAIFLPPLAPDLEFEGVSVYRDMPEVQDGDTASRTEKVTLVFDAGGEFSIPGMELSYWNTESRTIEVAAADGPVISVQGAPAVPERAESATESRWQWWAAMVIVAAILLLVIRRAFPAIVQRYRAASERRRQSEGYAFGRLTRALASDDGRAVYGALLRWVDKLEPSMSAQTFAARYGNESLPALVTALSAGIYGDTGKTADLRELGQLLAAARRRYRQSDSARSMSRLPPLNP
jgi:hypothetical protein